MAWRLVPLALFVLALQALSACGRGADTSSSTVSSAPAQAPVGDCSEFAPPTRSYRQYSCALDEAAVSTRIQSSASSWLRYSENRQGTGSSGHAIARHVGRSSDWLAYRLSCQNIAAASSYPDGATAEAIVGSGIAARQKQVLKWLKKPQSDTKLTLTVPCEAGACGVVLDRNSGEMLEAQKAVVVLHKECTGEGLGFFVLTSYPSL
jgi:hypothetical protein